MDNRYIDPETGKFKDSKKSEIAGGIAGGLAGSLGINALQSYQQYKGDLTDRAELAQELPLMQQDQRQVEQALSDAELLQQIKRDPSLLDQMSPDMRTHFSDVYDVSNRLEGRNNFDKVHELPMKERLKTFIKGKPSLEDVDPELVEYVTGKFGHRPFDPEVTDVLRGQAAGIGQDVSNLTQYLKQQPKFNMKAALPSLDNYRPKKMMSTIMHPLVTGGAMLGVGAGMMADEYRHHLSNIEQRELQKQAGFSNMFKKLMPKKPPTPPGPTPVPKKPLIPKAVKRTGLILGAAGLGGYSMVKAKDDFATGAKMAPSAEKMEGMDQKMNKQAALYAELEKVAFDGGSDEYWSTYADQQNRGPVKRAVDGAHEIGVNVAEGARGLGANISEGASQLAGNVRDAAGNVPTGVRKGLGIGAGVAGAAGLGYGGYEAYNHLQGQEQMAAERYEELSKEAGIGSAFKSGYNTLRGTTGKRLKEYGETLSREGRMTGERATKIQEKADAANKKTRNARIGVGAGVSVTGAAGAGGVMAGKRTKEEEPMQVTAAEMYDHLAKEAGVGSSIKKGYNATKEFGKTQYNHLTGQYVKVSKDLKDHAAKRGFTSESLTNGLDELHDEALKGRRNARIGAGVGVGVAGAGGTAAVMAHNKKKEEKTASELYEQLSKEAGIGEMAASAGKAIKDGANVLAGTTGKRVQGISNDLARQGRLTQERATKLQGKTDAANKLTSNARIGVGAGIGVAGAGFAAGKASGGQQKTASEEEQGQEHSVLKGSLKGGALGLGAGGALGAGLGAYGLQNYTSKAVNAANIPEVPEEVKNLISELDLEKQTRVGSRIIGGLGGGVAGAGLGLGAGLAGGGIAAALANRGQQQEQVAGTEEGHIEKVAHEAINELFGESTQTILNDTIEKIAGYTDPMDRITFSYDNLKK